MPDQAPYSFQAAFDRNIGWLTEWEQLALRGKCVAVAGCGGVGGGYILTLARLGIGGLHISDIDEFEVVNFNRQAGASTRSLGRPKVEVMNELALEINPHLRIRKFDVGINPENIDDFLSGADLFIDGFDFFVLDIRRRVFARCAELGIPALTAAPVGMGVGFLAFTKNGMSFEDYFRFEGKSELRQYVNFLLGVAPSGMHRHYLVDKTTLDFGRRRAPSTIIGCQLCASVVAAAAVKLLLKRGEIKSAPYHHHYDAYLGKLVITHLRWGNSGPLQRLRGKVAERAFGAVLQRPAPSERYYPRTAVEDILDIARWAPSGDNAQPWRFEISGENAVTVRIRDDSRENVYEYRNAEPTLLSAGTLLENMRIAASSLGFGMEWSYQGQENAQHQIVARFSPVAAIESDPLFAQIASRSVDRRSYRWRTLSDKEKERLNEALGNHLTIEWHEKLADRWRIAKLNALSTDIRLRIPETFSIHQRMLDWKRTNSPNGIPAKAVGLDAMTLRIMRWAMQSWSRTKLVNNLAGTRPAALQLDLLPGLFSAAYFTLRMPGVLPSPAHRTIALFQAGQAIQRFWLTATELDLVLQPCLATIAFAHYGKTQSRFTESAAVRRRAEALAKTFELVLGAGPEEIIFVARIGVPKAESRLCRSTRLTLRQLMENGNVEDASAAV